MKNPEVNNYEDDDDEVEYFDDTIAIGKAHSFVQNQQTRLVEGTKAGTKKLFSHFGNVISNLPPAFWDSTTMAPDSTRMISNSTQVEVCLQKHRASIVCNNTQFDLYEHIDPATFKKFERTVKRVYNKRRNHTDTSEISSAIKFLEGLGKVQGPTMGFHLPVVA